MLGQHGATCVPVGVPLVSPLTFAHRPRLGPCCWQVGLGAMTVNLQLALTAPTALSPSQLLANGLEGAPLPLFCHTGLEGE